jgi:peptidoglycan/xylan/chitin deacetylase (PgdA/CDA1 family)
LHRPPAAAALARLIRLGLPLYCGSPRRRYLALTFDDGPGPRTEAAIRLLRRSGDRATFFLVGRNLGRWPHEPRAELRVGAIGDHTWTHPFLTHLRASAVESEIARTQAAIGRATGTAVRLFRPPYGFRDATVDRDARRLGMLEVLWSLDSHDSFPPPGASAPEIERTVEQFARPGSIVLLHENLSATAAALPVLLRELRARRLRVVSVPQLLVLDRPTEAQLREGIHGCPAANA